MKKTKIFIICSINSTGLVNDGIILASYIQKFRNNTICIKHKGQKSIFKKFIIVLNVLFRKYLLGQQVFCIHLENVHMKWMRIANVNIFMPNPEWVSPQTMQILSRFDRVWCKTHFTFDIFSNKFSSCQYTGFISKNFIQNKYSKDFKKFIHIAGSTPNKGTRPLLDIWYKHPEWPELVVIARKSILDRHNYVAKNITIISEFVSEQQLTELINTCGIHLCPSETEGFGHTLVEGLSSKAIVLTLNATPMNELISKEFGVLVDYQSDEPQALGQRFYINHEDLEKKIKYVLLLKHSELEQMSVKARQQYLNLEDSFCNQLQTELDYLCI